MANPRRIGAIRRGVERGRIEASPLWRRCATLRPMVSKESQSPPWLTRMSQVHRGDSRNTQQNENRLTTPKGLGHYIG